MTQEFIFHPCSGLAKLACGILFLAAVNPLSAQQTPQPTRAPAQGHAPVQAAPESSHMLLAKHLPMQAQRYYEGVWGVDSLAVKYTESGEMIRFSYRVVDSKKAAVLNDKKAEPSLIDPQAGVKLVIPQMENIGQLRQTSTAIDGKSYWMAFSNSGRRVRQGDRVDVEIGGFRAQGLVVE
jgi:hypothetical protein